MRFITPQFIDIEDTIIGPITLRQFFLLIGGGLVIAALWWLFDLWFVLLVGTPIALVLLAIIFIKVRGQSLPKFFSAWFSFWTRPRFYVWKKDNK